MKIFEYVERLTRWAGNALLIASAAAMLLMMFHIFADVVARYFFNSPIEGTMETTTIYYMTMVAVLPWAYITQREGHIVVELFTSGLSKRHLAGLQVLVGSLTLVALLVMAWMTGVDAVAKTLIGEVRESGVTMIAQWPTRWILPVGSGMSALCVFLEMVRHFRTFLGIGLPIP